MKKIGCLTFHGSHNYGSSLQTYALKRAVEMIDDTFEYHVINLRLASQDNLYRSIFEKSDLKSIYSRLFFLGQKNKLKIKYDKFEKFINGEFNLTKRFNEDDLNVNDFDSIICGSDQIWNIRASDFSWDYFMDFNTKASKISYACSMGTKEITFSDDEKHKIKNLLQGFEYISVRDENTKRSIENITNKKIDILVDPTLLLDCKEWDKLICRYDCIQRKDKYIFFYDLSHSKENWKIAKRIGKQFGLPVIISSIPYPRVVNQTIGFKKQLDCGPVDFINLIKNAELVLTSSFHGTVFSTIFNRPFFSINSLSDMRINYFLNQIGMEDRIITKENYLEKIPGYKTISFENSNKVIQEKRSYCIKKLEEALCL